jgi:hypothetical protein
VKVEPGNCSCGKPLAWGHVVKVEGDVALVCTCTEGCTCKIDATDPTKCGCGKESASASGTGLLVTAIAPQPHLGDAREVRLRHGPEDQQLIEPNLAETRARGSDIGPPIFYLRSPTFDRLAWPTSVAPRGDEDVGLAGIRVVAVGAEHEGPAVGSETEAVESAAEGDLFEAAAAEPDQKSRTRPAGIAVEGEDDPLPAE